jgi:triosephosphate isomerase
MNSTVHEFSNYIDEFLPKVKNSKNNIALCVPYTHLMLAGQKLVSTNVEYGAQNISTEEKGALTGEISNLMVKDLGATHAIVGHSERRTMHHETDAVVCQKAKNAIEAGLVAVVCIGETETEREAGEALNVVARQIKGSVPLNATAENCVIAYEPVWAIGTGKTPTTADVAEVHAAIRQELTALLGEKVADKMRV